VGQVFFGNARPAILNAHFVHVCLVVATGSLPARDGDLDLAAFRRKFDGIGEEVEKYLFERVGIVDVCHLRALGLELYVDALLLGEVGKGQDHAFEQLCQVAAPTGQLHAPRIDLG